MTSITVRDLLRKLFRPSPRTKTPPRPRSFRPTLEFLEGRIVPAPVVTGISPNNGPQSGATEVVITGSGFTGATSAAFGGAARCTACSRTARSTSGRPTTRPATWTSP